MQQLTLPIIALLCLCGSLSALDGANMEPGFHRNLTCVEDASFGYEMFVPKAYAEHPERRFPTLFISSPTAKPHTRNFLDWAEEHGFIVIGLLNSRNGPYENNRINQDLVDRTIEAHGIRVHPHLRYALGGSGGGSSSFKWVARKPMQFAGLHISIHSGDDVDLAPHLVLSYFARNQDQNVAIKYINSAVERHRGNGNLVRYDRMDGGHKGAPDGLQEDHVSWMYWHTLFNHPHHTPQDIEAGQQILREFHERLSAMDQLTERQSRLEAILVSPTVRRSPEGKELLALWTSGVEEQITNASDDRQRLLAIFSASQQPWFAEIDTAIRRDLGKQLRTLSRKDDLRDEATAFNAFQRASKMADEARNDRQREEASNAFRTIAEHLGDTHYGKLAAEKGQ